MIVKRQRDHVHIQTTTCGALVEVLAGADVTPTIALVRDIRVTVPHYHEGFEEVYFVLEGTMTVRLYEPESREMCDVELRKHELCVIPRGVHHQVVRSSYESLLCALSVPRFDRSDEHSSDAVGWSSTREPALATAS
jgi:mannose-6-phosphate isomerase-like protein (cupin superfamily)